MGTVRRRKSVTLDGSGNGTVDFDVWSANHRWVIREVVVTTSQASTQTPYPTATTYLGGIQQGVSEGATWTGNQDVFRGHLDMTAGDTLNVVFTGGVAGTIANATIEGDNYLWRLAGVT